MKTNQTCISNHPGQCPRFWRVLPALAGAAVALAVATLSPASAAAADITWKLTNSVTGVTGNFSDGTSWVGGVAPTIADRAVFAITNANTPICTVVTSTNIEGFVYTAVTNAVADSGSGATFTINAGQQLSVLGADGFLMHNFTGQFGVRAKRIITISGNSLLVSNTAANFVLNSGVTYNQSGTWDTYTMSGLTNLTFWGNAFGLGDGILAGELQTGEQENQVVLPQTNIITACLANDYTQLDFTNSVEIGRQASAANNSVPQNSMVELGRYNAFYCDSFGLGRGFIGGNTANMAMSAVNAANGKNSVGYQVSFLSVNATNPTSLAIFRNTNGVGRMSLLAIGVDSGSSLTNSRNNGILNLTGGKVDMLVDQIWLGRNRFFVNVGTTNSSCGGFSFENGTVDANIVRAGFMQYSNTEYAIGLLMVGTNGVLKVNNYLELGHTPADVDPTGIYGGPELSTFGQLQINSGGAALLNQVNVGAVTTNNTITVNSGGLLLVSNTIANNSKSLTTLNLASSAQVTFFVNSTTTNAYVTNLLTGASAASFNIGSFDTNGIISWPVTNVLVSYQAAGSHNVSVGTKPAGATNLNMYVKDDTANNQIILITSTNVQKHLVWRGSPGNALWDHISPNWTNTDSGGITAFSDNDIVSFDDSAASGNCNITIADNVTPASILVTNSVNQYVFNGINNNTYSIGGCSLTKTGTNSLEIDSIPTSIAVTVNKGSLTGSGMVNSIIIASGASMNFAGTDTTSLDDSGNATLAHGGVVNGAVTIESGASFANAGTTYGALSMGTGSTVNNTGLMTGIGAATVTTNSILNNSGTIYSLGNFTVALGGTLVDTFAGSASQAAGSINVGTLIVNGTFKPGGSSVSTTKVTDYDYNGGSPQPLLSPYGRVQLNAGSVTVLNVNMGLAPGQTNTVLLSQNQVFGPSQNFKTFNGGVLVISNLNAIANPFAAGQTFKLFARYTDNNGDIRDAGLNSTNAYPIIRPSTPGPGLVWDLSQLYPHGIIGVLSATDPSLMFTLTNNQYIVNDNGTNRIITQLTWPQDKMGGWVQQLNATLTNGLSATNWFSINGNYGNTNAGIQIMSDTNVWFLTNSIVADPTQPGSAVFFRFVYP